MGVTTLGTGRPTPTLGRAVADPEAAFEGQVALDDDGTRLTVDREAQS